MAANVAGEFVMRCFHARTNAHVLHLKTGSYAVHKALNEFYDGLIPFIDSFAEAYQGEYGLIDDYPGQYKEVADPVALVEGLVEWIDENRDEICDDTYCQNIIDEIVALSRSTIYKLRFLK